MVSVAGLTPEVREALASLLPDKDIFERTRATEHLEDFIALMLPTYKRTPWTRVLCEHLEAVYRRDLQKLIVLAPPRHGKSDHCTVYWPAWVLGKQAGARFIITSYSDNMAWDFSKKMRDVIRDVRYPFPVAVRADIKGARQFKTNRSGIPDGEVNAAGLTGSLTGKGADRVVFDDPTRNWEDAMSEGLREANWNAYNAVLKTRIERLNKAPTVIIPAYRWHDDDLVGRILNAPDAKEWTVLKAPALASPTEDEPDPLEREDGVALSPEIGFTREVLEKLRDEWLYGEGQGTPAMWYSMYQQDPVPRGEAMFRPDKWGFWHKETGLPRLVRVEHLIDTSFGEHLTSDFTAWATVGKGVDGNFYWLEIGRKRMQFMEVAQRFEALQKVDARRPLVFEHTHSAVSAIQYLRARGCRVVEWEHRNRDKVALSEPASEHQRLGKCFLPADYPREILAAFIDEHARFPKGKYDDWVSTTYMALDRLAKAGARVTKGSYFVGDTAWRARNQEAAITDAWEGHDPFGRF